MAGGVLEAGVARAGAHQGVFASKGKVAPLTVDICNIHTHQITTTLGKRVSAQLKQSLPAPKQKLIGAYDQSFLPHLTMCYYVSSQLFLGSFSFLIWPYKILPLFAI